MFGKRSHQSKDPKIILNQFTEGTNQDIDVFFNTHTILVTILIYSLLSFNMKIIY